MSRRGSVNNTAVNNSVAFCEWSDEYIAKLLSKIKNTSPGYDGIPSWFYFRPISVTSLLCRLTEKLVVRNYVQPTFKNLDITDQYAYKPTGNTTAALI